MTIMPNEEEQVRQAVQSFYDAFNSHDFGRLEEFITEDWNHINPLGGWTRGREDVLAELMEVHSTFLKGVSDTVEEISVRFATPDAAVVTVPSRMSTFTTPDGSGMRTSKRFVLSSWCGVAAGGGSCTTRTRSEAGELARRPNIGRQRTRIQQVLPHKKG